MNGAIGLPISAALLIATAMATATATLTTIATAATATLASIAAATAATAATAVTAASATLTAVTAATATLTAVTTAALLVEGLGLRSVDPQGTTLEFLAVDGLNGSVDLRLVTERHERKPFGSARFTVSDDFHPLDGSVSGEEFGNFLFSGRVGQVAHVDVHIQSG
jgi:hypothetical protein